jgi:hypothetical protein
MASSVTLLKPVRILPLLLHAVWDVPRKYAGQEIAGGVERSTFNVNIK